MLISHHADAGDRLCERKSFVYFNVFGRVCEQGHPSSKMMSRHENKFFQLRSFRNPARKFPDRRKETISYVAPFWCHKTTFAGATKLTERVKHGRQRRSRACRPSSDPSPAAPCARLRTRRPGHLSNPSTEGAWIAHRDVIRIAAVWPRQRWRWSQSARTRARSR